MQQFREIKATQADPHLLQSEMGTHGYVLIRNLLSADQLRPLLNEITQILHTAGWLEPDSDSIQRIARNEIACSDGEPSFKSVYDEVFNLQSFHAFPHQEGLRRVMEMLVGRELFIHPKSAARLIFPNYERGIVHAHQDHTAVAGDSESFTAWIPLHDCPMEMGPLKILEGSHRYGLQPTVAGSGYISPGTERGDSWVGGPIFAGDLLLFHSLTVHEALPNRSDRLRVSLDCRFQSYKRAVNPGALGFAGSGRRSWEKTYANWTSDELRYYWKRLPLTFKPTKAELAELARTADTPEMRSRYAKIFEMI